jgi:DNA (cytosine-5)-methyltransferase 1
MYGRSRERNAMILDLCAGSGGWDVAAQRLGLDPLGVEIDDAACATREAAGLRTVQHDVRTLDIGDHWLDGLIASPPCQTFSMAGKGAGRVALEQVLLGVKRLCTGEPIPYEEYDDIRTGLVLEPLRYALKLEPEWIAWEQVPTVQPVWDACADVLRQEGYSVWTGHLHAEQYGVPQTRKRSVLIASRSREMSKPTPTHSRFYPRNPSKLDEGVAKWVSMAEALGWGMTHRPAMTVTGGGSATGGAELFGNAARQGILREQSSGRWGAKPLGSGSGAARAMLKESQEGRWLEPTPANPADSAEDTAWVHERPSPTIVGSFAPDVVAAPGYRTTVSRQNAKGSVRVTVQEAAVLQSFPLDHPWQGSRTKQYQQVGNAIPPLLALHVLSHVTGTAMPAEFIADEGAS